MKNVRLGDICQLMIQILSIEWKHNCPRIDRNNQQQQFLLIVEEKVEAMLPIHGTLDIMKNEIKNKNIIYGENPEFEKKR